MTILQKVTEDPLSYDMNDRFSIQDLRRDIEDEYDFTGADQSKLDSLWDVAVMIGQNDLLSIVSAYEEIVDFARKDVAAKDTMQ